MPEKPIQDADFLFSHRIKSVGNSGYQRNVKKNKLIAQEQFRKKIFCIGVKEDSTA